MIGVLIFFLPKGQKIVNEMLSMRHKSNGLIGKIENMDDITIKSIVTDLIIAAGDTVRNKLCYDLVQNLKQKLEKSELGT